jgi:hypothetical protein
LLHRRIFRARFDLPCAAVERNLAAAAWRHRHRDAAVARSVRPSSNSAMVIPLDRPSCDARRAPATPAMHTIAVATAAIAPAP